MELNFCMMQGSPCTCKRLKWQRERPHFFCFLEYNIFLYMSLLFWTILRSITNDPNSQGTFGEMIVTSMFTSKFFGNEERYLVNNLFFEDTTGTHQIDHILIYHKGIFCIETRHIDGLIVGEVDGGHWGMMVNGKRHHLFNPVKQNSIHVKFLNEFFENKYPVFDVRPKSWTFF